MLMSTPVNKHSSEAKVSERTSPPHPGAIRPHKQSRICVAKKLADDEFMAAAIGDVQWLKQSLAESGAVVKYDKNGLAAIHVSALHGHLDCLKTCIEKYKVDINLPSLTGWRAIHLAVNKKSGERSLQCLSYLLGKGADTSITNNEGTTPIHQAASEGHVPCLKMLLEAKATFDSHDCRGNTPLDLARLWGHQDCARILAAEMWHQDKSLLMREMHHLNKYRMYYLLRKFEEEEKSSETRQISADNAFKQWMAAKSLGENGDIYTSQHLTKLDTQISCDSNKCNPVSRSRSEEPLNGKINIHGRHSNNKLPGDFRSNSRSDSVFGHRGPQKKPLLKKPLSAGNAKTQHLQPCRSGWDISTKPENLLHLPILGDDYPRDEYTMMPTLKGAPKFFDGKFVHAVNLAGLDKSSEGMRSGAKFRKPKLPDEVIHDVLFNGSQAESRGIIFKCKHIEDVNTKKKFDPNKTGRSEVPLHLMNDVRSFLVQNSVVIKSNSLENLG